MHFGWERVYVITSVAYTAAAAHAAVSCSTMRILCHAIKTQLKSSAEQPLDGSRAVATACKEIPCPFPVIVARVQRAACACDEYTPALMQQRHFELCHYCIH